MLLLECREKQQQHNNGEQMQNDVTLQAASILEAIMCALREGHMTTQDLCDYKIRLQDPIFECFGVSEKIKMIYYDLLCFITKALR
jgi:hypothetical protein